MKRRVPFAVLWAGLLAGAAASLGVGDGSAQSPPLRDPQAVAVVSEALKALDGQTTINDVTLEGSVAFTAGSDQESGTATLVARGSQQSRVVLHLGGGERQEVRHSQQGMWMSPDGQPHAMAGHNCWTDASWFFPALSLQALLADPQITVVYRGDESRGGLTARHLRISRVPPGQSAEMAAWIQRLSTTDVFLDAASYLPVAAIFSIHPDNNAGLDIPVEVQFSDYRLLDGVKVPFHVKKLLQGSLMLDLNIASAAVNSGVPESEFTIPGAEQ